MAEDPLLARPAVVRRDEEQGVRAVRLGEAGKLDGLLVVVDALPGTKGTLPSTAAAAARITSFRSSRDSEPGSPVVPCTDTPWDPLRICHSTRSARPSRSSDPFLKGVTTGTIDPRIHPPLSTVRAALK